jgi:hypothetical protein
VPGTAAFKDETVTGTANFIEVAPDFAPAECPADSEPEGFRTQNAYCRTGQTET